MTFTTQQTETLIGQARALAFQLDNAMLLDVTDAMRLLLVEIASLRADAERWRKFESDCDGAHGEVVDHHRQMHLPTSRIISYAEAEMRSQSLSVIYDDVPVRQIRFRWLDVDGKRRTVREMIDAQLKELNETGEAT